MTVQERIRDLQSTLVEAPSQQEKLKIIIELGEELEQAPRESFIDEDKVPGCASDAFVKIELHENKIRFSCFSASLVIKGYIALLLEVFQECTPEEMLGADTMIEEFLSATGLDVVSIVPSRTNSFSRLYAFMKDKTKWLIK